ncbi:MAG: hypothetical protein ACRELY_32715 [Polyangiaceae bacterium]
MRALGIVTCFAIAALAACSGSSDDSSSNGATGGDDAGSSSSNGDGGSASGSGDGGSSSSKDSGSSSGGNGSSKPSCKYTAHATGLNAFQQSGGLAFHVYAPASYDPNVGHRVVFIMHGQDSDGTGELTSLWQPIADTEQLVLVAPKGSQPSTDPTDYPNGANWSVDDLNHIQDLVTEIDDCYNVDVKRHILWGFSEGCFYGYLLGIGAATQFSGLAMGGANTSFARENGYPPSAETWHIPVSHVQGTTDPNGTAQPEQDKIDFMAAGSVFTLYEPVQGHTITQAQVMQQYQDLKDSSSP